ncbi:endonuclease/exonuclease/phosphatase family protein [Azomonas macrocytogenes]|uniref:Endonuclease/exonuclease/phosphatase family metal-dependent hydrolase n=1 Tax=Azomonas macrocytogenes TaxID=69962 RepID=A0A839T0H8_AZOMA|nr:endonuclease/exonuclease/phosphatase family protein [Azomonas macrocytogenes]MBB3103051.1 endonuclease/exonuclease/phosphatase family metal-dependent hydrolase [Azomonas macrocytogenes]
MQLKVVSVNIERSKHLHRVEQFLKREQPEILCLQELCQRDIPFFEDLLGNKLSFAPMSHHPAEEELEVVGVGLVARGAMTDITTTYYSGSAENIREICFVTADGYRCVDPESVAEVVIAGTYRGFRIATTHLNVTHFGISTPYQLESAGKLIHLAEAEAQKEGGLLLAGDFNAPRGNATFGLIGQHFIDGVPAHYTTSIDGSLHRSGQIPFMVDGLFHTSDYTLENAILSTGVSDHCALSCRLMKR